MFISEAVYPPLKVARERTDEWDSLAEAKQYFSNRKLFTKFDEDILENFFKYGLQQKEGSDKWTLTFSTEAEYNMMKTVPTCIPPLSGKTRIYEDADELEGSYVYSKIHVSYFCLIV